MAGVADRRLAAITGLIQRRVRKSDQHRTRQPRANVGLHLDDPTLQPDERHGPCTCCCHSAHLHLEACGRRSESCGPAETCGNARVGGCGNEPFDLCALPGLTPPAARNPPVERRGPIRWLAQSGLRPRGSLDLDWRVDFSALSLGKLLHLVVAEMHTLIRTCLRFWHDGASRETTCCHGRQTPGVAQ